MNFKLVSENYHSDTPESNKILFSEIEKVIPNIEMIYSLIQDPTLNINAIGEFRGATALLEACYNGNADIVEALLEHPNINPNIQDSLGFTPLMIASQMGNHRIIEMLLQLPITNVEIRNSKRKSAWGLADHNTRAMFPELNPIKRQ
jgi:ankyrin repeat protein